MFSEVSKRRVNIRDEMWQLSGAFKRLKN